jgi:Ca2+-binding EF-hand superfamily protein
MTYDEFASAVRVTSPDAGDDMVKAAWDLANKNDDNRLSWEEFKNLFELGKEGAETPDPARMFWDMFVTDEKRGMSFDEFAKGTRMGNPAISDDQLKPAFEMMDRDGSRTLTWEEFKAIFDMANGGRSPGAGGQDPRKLYSNFASDAKGGL